MRTVAGCDLEVKLVKMAFVLSEEKLCNYSMGNSVTRAKV